MDQLFETASRKKLRFVGFTGTLLVEDLWDLPLQHTSKLSLDAIAMNLNQQLQKAQQQTSFVKPESNSVTEELELSFEIVKHIIAVKVGERDATKLAREKAEKKQKLLGLLDQKENEQLSSLSAEELRKQIAEL